MSDRIPGRNQETKSGDAAITRGFSSGNRTGRRMAAGLFVIMALVSGAFAIASFQSAGAEQPATAQGGQLVDIRGRSVTIHGPAERIAIDDSRFLVALGLIHPDPVSLLAAWPQDVNRLGTDTYEQLLEISPELADLPRIASSAGSFNMEALLAARPDLALLSLESGITDAQIAQIEAAGIPVVQVDFFVQPLENLEKSLRLLGQLTGREAQAEEFLAFRTERMTAIADKVAALPEDDRPSVFLEAHAGITNDCCNSPGRGNVGDYISFVGGHNIGSDVISQSFGKLNLEYVISREPDVYIATGGPHLEKSGGLVLGTGYDEATARESLRRVAARKGISGLSAVKSGRVHGFSHQLINSPLDVVAVETFAKWIHPEIFGDLDPGATLAEINQRFLSLPYEGVYWVDLTE
ncbi:ABC transporter substrate-binding protein [Pontibaca methylaminivorans]|uniref:ABC transporter substrate-binding protein n=1 Tax=Pontibaca methylaminivorans TaxID=515897 RepID=UPI002FDB0874